MKPNICSYLGSILWNTEHLLQWKLGLLTRGRDKKNTGLVCWGLFAQAACGKHMNVGIWQWSLALWKINPIEIPGFFTLFQLTVLCFHLHFCKGFIVNCVPPSRAHGLLPQLSVNYFHLITFHLFLLLHNVLMQLLLLPTPANTAFFFGPICKNFLGFRKFSMLHEVKSLPRLRGFVERGHYTSLLIVGPFLFISSL